MPGVIRAVRTPGTSTSVAALASVDQVSPAGSDIRWSPMTSSMSAAATNSTVADTNAS